MVISDYATYLALTIPIVYSPGPMAMFILSNGIHSGFRKTMPALLGASTSYLIGIIIFAVGLASLFQKNPTILFTIQFLGVLYILYLAHEQLTDKKILDDTKVSKNINSFSLYKKGFLTALSNPKAILLFSIILPQFATSHTTKFMDISILGATFLVLQFSSGCLYGYFGEKVQYALQSPSRQKLIKQVSAAILLLVAALLGLHLFR